LGGLKDLGIICLGDIKIGIIFIMSKIEFSFLHSSYEIYKQKNPIPSGMGFYILRLKIYFRLT